MLVDIFIVLAISIAINVFFFAFAFKLKSDVFTDVTYALTFLITTIIVMIINSAFEVNQLLTFVLVALWSLRLGTFLFIRIRKTKVDHRFDKIRHSFWKFGLFWLLQAVTVWVVNMPTYISIINPGTNFYYISILPLILALFGLSIEMIADLQKYHFNQKNPGKFINIGLWKISRHPNYFGEICFWLMLTAFVLINNFKYINLIALVGPFYIIFTLYKISGVPILERQSYNLFGKDPAYIKYLNKTPCLIPFIGKKGFNKTWIRKNKK